jgi:ribonuclease HI
MSKKLFIRTLNMIAKHFKSNKNVLEAIDYLLEACEQIEEIEKTNVITDFVLPAESLKRKGTISLFTDGACRGNPGPGSWAIIGQNADGEIIFQASGIDVNTTNNKMELSAVIEALKNLDYYLKEQKLKSDTPVVLFSDSKYVLDGLNSWVSGWKARGWKKADNKTPENIELWKELDTLRLNYSELELVWVKGHSGHPQNEYCDKLANDELDINGF